MSAADPAQPSLRPRWALLAQSLDGLAAILPTSIGCAALLAPLIAPQSPGQAMAGCLLGLALMHLVTAGNRRPVVFAARFFEAAALAAMLQSMLPWLPAWGLLDTPAARLALLTGIGLCAALWFALLGALRVQRFLRFIPAPVFSGFNNSAAIVILSSQSQQLWGLADGQWSQLGPVGAVAACALAGAWAMARWRPAWPASALGLLVASGLAWWLQQVQGLPVDWVAQVNLQVVPLPGSWVFGGLTSAGTGPVAWMALGSELLKAGVVMGTLVFLAAAITSQQMGQIDDCPPLAPADTHRIAAGLALGSLVGAMPMSGSISSSAAVLRHGEMRPRLLLGLAALFLGLLASGALGLMPLAGLAGVLLFEAGRMVDASPLRPLWRRRASGTPARHQVEDAALVAAVMATALAVNTVAALAVGLTLGLLLQAQRQSANPVRAVWTGREVGSLCARPAEELALLARHAQRLRVAELDVHQFFATTGVVSQVVRQQLAEADCVVLDWSRVGDIDSSVAAMLVRLQRQAQQSRVLLAHGGTTEQAGNLAGLLAQHLPAAHRFADLDRALEWAENQILAHHDPQGAVRAGPDAPVVSDAEARALLWQASLLRGLPAADRGVLAQQMLLRAVAAGGAIVRMGEASDALCILLSGHASVVIQRPDGGELRLAGIGAGASVGEIGFLDGAPRSASVLADGPLWVADLPRAAFDQLAETHPALVQQVLTILAIDIASRLRRSTQLAVARQRRAG